MKNWHEIRDPIHGFIKISDDERRILDSEPVQRLRHIHQLAMTFLVYPGATHRRFEHSLGTMQLATRVFDVVTDADNLCDEVRQAVPASREKLEHWKRTVRAAALLHDVGHLPFSHAAEKRLLPTGWKHERFTYELILSPKIRELLNSLTPPLRAEEVAKLAVGHESAGPEAFDTWEILLSEMIVGDVFGADRMDYLLRDSLHAGVAYGRFDHQRLIDTLRILPSARKDDKLDTGLQEPELGVEEGGIHAAEGLLLARYFMFAQVYLHHVRRIYDIHLADFLCQWLPNHQFPTSLPQFLQINDNVVMAEIHKHAARGMDTAKRLADRKHFKLLYERDPDELDARQKIYRAAVEEFGPDSVRQDWYVDKVKILSFPVKMADGHVVDSMARSDVLGNLPYAKVDYVFVAREKLEEARRWLTDKRDEVIRAEGETDGEAEEGGSSDGACPPDDRPR
jgi:HD superfamily phosphohydrolase